MVSWSEMEAQGDEIVRLQEENEELRRMLQLALNVIESVPKDHYCLSCRALWVEKMKEHRQKIEYALGLEGEP